MLSTKVRIICTSPERTAQSKPGMELVSSGASCQDEVRPSPSSIVDENGGEGALWGRRQDPFRDPVVASQVIEENGARSFQSY